MGYYNEGRWWASPYNDFTEVQRNCWLGQPVEIHDATLRDGEQTPGVVFSTQEKVAIAEKLIEAGVTRIEAGMPAVSRPDFDAIKEISSTFKEAKVYAFARAVRGDIDMARDCGVTGVVIEVPIGYPKLLHQFHWTWENVLEKSVDCVNYARSQGLKTVYFPYDATRARPEDIEGLLKGMMENAPPDSIGVVDTMGCAMPQAIAYLVKWFKRLTGLPIEVHTHNDFGMAVATELAGISAGASCVHSCVNGLGERTGNASLEELVAAMNILMGMETPYRLDKLPALCELVSKLSCVPIAPNKPVCGARNYTRESGIGVDLVLKQPLAMFATDPALFGRRGDIALGKKSGKASVAYYLEQMGIAASDEQMADMLERVKTLGISEKRLLTNKEFSDIVQIVTG